MAKKHLPQAERLLSGNLSALLSDVATTMTVSNPPSAAKIPTYLEIDPDSSADSETVKVTGVAGGVCTIQRGVYTGGVGKQHLANASYKQKITQLHWDAVVEALETGFLSEDDSLTFTKNTTSIFRVNGVDQTAYYTEGRRVRLNASILVTVVSSAYSGGNTVVTINEATVPVTITSVEIAIGPEGFENTFAHATKVQNAAYTYDEDVAADDSYAVTLSPIPTAYVAGMTVVFKANTANTGACTLNVNTLGAIDIRKNKDQALATGDILAGQIVTVVYDGTVFQLQTSDLVKIQQDLVDQVSAPAAPASGNTRIFSKTDGRVYKEDSAGIVRSVGEDTWEALTDGATVTLDWSTSVKKILKAIGGNRTIAHSNIVAGRFIAFFCRQDGTGSRIPVWDATGSEVFAPAAVNVADNKITVTEDVPTGTPIKFTTATTLPAGLTAGVQYYAINVDATTISVATSVANAQAGTAIDITDQGTGNHTIHYYIKWDGTAAPILSTGKFLMDKFVLQAYSTKIVGGSIAGQGEI